MDDGVIKFKFRLKKSGTISSREYLDVEKWRAIFFKMRLVGEDSESHIGYGNLSKRISGSDQFIITGTQTGHLPHLNGSQYTKVTSCDLKSLSVDAIGPIPPSSESLTHFAFYQKCKQINFIFHIHSSKLWNHMISEKMNSTPQDVSYGTQEMAIAVQNIIGNKESGIIVMKGHQDGVIAYGNSAEQAGRMVLNSINEIPNN